MQSRSLRTFLAVGCLLLYMSCTDWASGKKWHSGAHATRMESNAYLGTWTSCLCAIWVMMFLASLFVFGILWHPILDRKSIHSSWSVSLSSRTALKSVASSTHEYLRSPVISASSVSSCSFLVRQVAKTGDSSRGHILQSKSPFTRICPIDIQWSALASGLRAGTRCSSPKIMYRLPLRDLVNLHHLHL